METNNYFTQDGYFTHSLPATPGTSSPFNATREALPDSVPGYWPKWEDGAWLMVQDLRGTEFWYPDGYSDTIKELGESLPAGVLTTPPPTIIHTTHNGSEWLLDKDRLIKAVQENRKEALNAGFLVDGVLFDSDYNARIAYEELRSRFALDPEYSRRWKASGTTWVTMDKTLFDQLQVAGEKHIADCFEWEETKTIAINQVEDPAEFANISIEFGT